MQQIQLAVAKNRLSEIARQAQQGETFELTVRGVPVARITPIPTQTNKEGFHQRVRAFMNRPGRPGMDIRAAIEDGRK
jgi:prevent-host-death family protein